MIYLGTFILFFLLSATQKKTQKYILPVLILYLIIIGGFRANYIGVDTANGYKTYWYYHLFGYNLSYVEKSWRLLMSLCSKLSLGYQGVLFIAEALCVLPVAYVIYKRTDINQIFALAVYFGMFQFLQSFNLIRQCMAMSFCFLSFYFFVNKKWVRTVVFYIIGVSFHKSAFIFLAAYVGSLFKHLNLKWILISLAITFIFGLFASRDILINLAGPYRRYLEGNVFGFRNYSANVFFLCAMMNAFFLFLLLCSNKEIYKSPYVRVIWVGLCCLNCTQRMELGTRIVLYFTQMQIIFFPEYLKTKHKEKDAFTILIILYLAANFGKIMLSQWKYITPYTFCFLDELI